MDYLVYFNSQDDETKILHKELPDDLRSRYNNSYSNSPNYIYKVSYEVYTGEEENLEKPITLTSQKELNIDELSDRVAEIYDNESEFNDYRLYQLVALYVKAAYINNK